jgi:hypothetical protein
MLAAEPTESTDAMEPADPIDKIDPAEPMDRIDPADPMDRIDPLDPMLKMEPSVFRIRSFSRGLSRGVHGAGGSQRALAGWLDVVISRTRVACSRFATTRASRRVSS